MISNTFGVKDAQFNVISIIRRHAETYLHAFPIAANALLSDVYTDDLLSGSNTIEEAQLLKSQIAEILATAGMQMKNGV